MNHIYRLTRNRKHKQLVPVPETAKGKGKTARRVSPAAIGFLAILPPLAFAQGIAPNTLPSGGQVAAGQAAISQQAAQMAVQQQSDKAIINWQSFDIGSQAAVTFLQPSASAIALNRVLAGGASQIEGRLTANGQVWLINPNGVVFGNGAQVDVGGLVASTLAITDQDFLDGKAVFSRNGASGSIINNGNITARDGGLVALLAPTVQNEGIVSAQLGNVVLAGGDTITLEAGANGLLYVAVDAATVNTLIENKQLIVADGGQVIMTSKAADALQSSIVANTGTVQARTLQEKDGRILLLADMGQGEVRQDGLLDASAPNGGNGGFIETSAAKVSVGETARVTTQAANGRTGTWLIDPTDYTIAASGGDITGTALSDNLAVNNITISTAGAGSDPGDIFVNADINWSSGNTLTLTADRDININNAISGENGGLTLNAAENINPTAAVNVGTFLLGAGRWEQKASSLPAFSAADFRLNNGVTFIRVLNTATPNQIIDVYGLQGIGTTLAASYGMANDIDASVTSGWNNGAGFVPIGKSGANYTGTFDGLGHVISDLTIDRPSTNYVGLFGYTRGAAIRNVGLAGGSVTGFAQVGGLVGYSYNSTVSNSYASGSVTSSGAQVGGLVGINNGSSVNNSYATGNVTGGNYVGGLVGDNYSSSAVANSYASGSVTGNSFVGGLVGRNSFASTVTNSYASGAVTGNSSVGGLVGFSDSFTVTSSYYAITDASGSSINNGGSNTGVWSGNTFGTGKSWTDLSNTGTFSGWDSNVWMLDGGGDAVAGYGVGGLPWLKDVTPEADRQGTTLFAGGMGVDGNAYIITSWQQLANIGYNSAVLGGGYHFELSQDLGSGSSGYTALASATANGDLGWNPLGNDSSKFTGTFDGLGHVISDLTIDRPSTSYVGLFGYTHGAAIRNVGLVGGSVTGSAQVGGLVGYSYNSTVNNSYASASITGSIAEVGGLVGINDGSSVNNSYTTGNVTGGNYVGGLVGTNYDSSAVTNSYASGSVTGDFSVGGLVGRNSFASTVTNSYASGAVTGNFSVGGLVGFSDSFTVSNSFWDKESTGRTTSAGSDDSFGKTTAEMKNPFTFIDAGWDFDGAWAKSSTGENNGYMMLEAVQSGSYYDGYLRVTGDLSRTYGASNPVLTSVITEAGNVGTVGFGSAITASTSVGSYHWDDANVVSVTGGGSNLYQVLDNASGISITSAALSVTANDDSRTAGGAPYSGGNGVGYSGFVNGENASVLGGSLTYGGTSQGATGAGTYTITPSGLTSTNYTISFNNGTLVIAAAPVTPPVEPPVPPVEPPVPPVEPPVPPVEPPVPPVEPPVPPVEPPAPSVGRSTIPDAGHLHRNTNQSTATTDSGVPAGAGASGIGVRPSPRLLDEQGGSSMGTHLLTLADGYIRLDDDDTRFKKRIPAR